MESNRNKVIKIFQFLSQKSLVYPQIKMFTSYSKQCTTTAVHSFTVFKTCSFQFYQYGTCVALRRSKLNLLFEQHFAKGLGSNMATRKVQ